MNQIKAMTSKLSTTGFFHIFGSSVVSKIITFLSSIILVRILTKQAYGSFTYAWNIYSLVLMLDGMGLVSGCLQFCSENSKNKTLCNGIYLYSTKIGVIFNCAIGLVLLAIAFFVPLPISGSNSLLVLLCCLPIVTFIYEMQIIYLRSNKENVSYAKISLIQVILVFTFSVVGAYIFKSAGLILARYIAYFLVAILAIGYIKPGKMEKIILPSDLKKSLFKISGISMLNNGLSQLLYLLDIFVIGIIAADGLSVASYKVATTIPNALAFIPLALVTYIYPYFAEHREDKSWCLKRYKVILIAMGAFNFCVSLGLFVMAPYIIKAFFGADYMDAVTSFRILSISYFFSGTFRVISGNLLVTQRKIGFNLFVAAFSGVVNIVGDYILVSLYGSEGAAVATFMVVLLTSLLSTAYLFYTYKHER
ncbi:MAG: oligosaccharide flippase family protein [Oscillospiraceae bacterium]